MARIELSMHLRYSTKNRLPPGQVSYKIGPQWYLCRRGRTGESVYRVTEYSPQEEEFLESIRDKGEEK